MAAMGTPQLGLSLGLQSAADSGDDIISPSFDVNFGNKLARPDPSVIGGLAKDIAVGLIVAVAAKFVWDYVR